MAKLCSNYCGFVYYCKYWFFFRIAMLQKWAWGYPHIFHYNHYKCIVKWVLNTKADVSHAHCEMILWLAWLIFHYFYAVTECYEKQDIQKTVIINEKKQEIDMKVIYDYDDRAFLMIFMRYVYVIFLGNRRRLWEIFFVCLWDRRKTLKVVHNF